MKKKLLLGFAAMLLSWTAWAALVDNDSTSPFFIEGINETGVITYAGDNTNPEITVKYGENAETATVLGEENYSLTYTFKGVGDEEETSVDGVRNVGHYTLTVEGKGLPYSFSPKKTIEFDVAPKQITEKLALTSTEKTYGDDDQDILSKLVTGFADGKALKDVLATRTDGDYQDEFENFLKCLEVGRNGTDDGQTVGEYQVIANGKTGDDIASNYRYTATAEGNYATLTINPKGLTVKIDYDREYKGKDKSVNMSSLATGKVNEKLLWYFDGDLTAYKDLPTISKFAASKDKDGNEITDSDVAQAGTYYLKAELSNNDEGNYAIANDGEIELVIKQAELAITLKDDVEEKWNEATYGDANIPTDFTGNFDFTTFVNNEQANDDDIKLTMQRKIGNDVVENGYAIMPYVNGTEVTLTNGENITALRNYKIVYAKENQQAFTIKAKDISTLIGIDLAINNLQYQGQAFDLTEGGLKVTYTAETESKELVETEYEVDSSAPITAKDAGTSFTVKVKGKGNYSGEKEETFTITRRTLTIAPKKAEDKAEDKDENVTIGKVYGTKDPENLLSTYFTVEGWAKQESMDETINKLRMARHNDGAVSEVVGEYAIYLYNGEGDEGYIDGKGSTQTKLPNYNIEYDFATKFYITPKELHYSVSATKVYDASDDFTKAQITINSDDLVTNEGLEIDDSEGNVFETQPEVAVDLAEGEKAKNVGEYTLKVNTEGTAKNYTPIYTASTEGDKYTITPGTVTITVKVPTVDFGTEIDEDLLAYWVAYRQNSTYTTIENTPNDGNDRAAIRSLLKLDLSEAAKKGESGTYEGGLIISIQDDVVTDELTKAGYSDATTLLNNYGYSMTAEDGTNDYFAMVNGDLTIGGATEDLTLDGAEDADALEDDQENILEKLERLNGAEIPNITVKHLKNFISRTGFGETDEMRKTDYYTLVLPFAVPVWELSNKLGYAVVYVPNTAKSDGDIYFKLEMEEVAANTLMILRIDRNKKWDDNEDAVLTFEGKKVFAPLEEYSQENGNADGGGNKFIPVYKKATIESSNDWIVTPWDGVFRAASNVPGGFTVYPLNGYVHFESLTAASRIYIEEFDGSTTAINAVTGEVVNNNAEGWYSVDGVKLNAQPTQKGIYINNGKKVVIK